MINFLKKLLNIKSKNKPPKDFISMPTSQGPVNVETDDPILAEMVAKAWDTGDTIVYENGKMTTIKKNNESKDN